MSTRKTEELVRKCFEKPLRAYEYNSYSFLARAARKFVREENKGKMRMLDMHNVDREVRAIDTPVKNWAKLPKHFGKEPDFGTMLKNIRNRIAKLKRVRRNNKQKGNEG